MGTRRLKFADDIQERIIISKESEKEVFMNEQA